MFSPQVAAAIATVCRHPDQIVPVEHTMDCDCGTGRYLVEANIKFTQIMDPPFIVHMHGVGHSHEVCEALALQAISYARKIWVSRMRLN